MNHNEASDQRPEGLYTKWVFYPPPPLVGTVRLLRIEKVNGNGTVDRITLTPGELDLLFSFILSGLKISHVL